jgi:hypothetical protein
MCPSPRSLTQCMVVRRHNGRSRPCSAQQCCRTYHQRSQHTRAHASRVSLDGTKDRATYPNNLAPRISAPIYSTTMAPSSIPGQPNRSPPATPNSPCNANDYSSESYSSPNTRSTPDKQRARRSGTHASSSWWFWLHGTITRLAQFRRCV